MLNSAKQILAKIATKHGADYLEKIPVITGNRAGVVDAGDGKIWVRFSTGLEARVINTLAPLAFDRHIMIGRLRSAPNVWRVAEIREVYLESDSNQFMPHHLQHEFGGFDQVNINRKQIISATAFVSDSENFLVRVYGGLFQTDSGWVLAQSTDGTPAHPDLDLSAEVPASGAVYVGIEADSDGVLSLNVGTPFAAPELATGADVPIPAAGSRLIAFVLLYETQTALLNEHISVPGLFASEAVDLADVVYTTDADWIDLTDGGATTLHSHAGGGGHVIENEGTPLAARSKLNFVGGGVTATDDSGDDASVVTVDEQTIGDLIEGSTSKATPVDADRFGFWDSVADILKYATWANIKSVLKTYFDTLYAAVANGVTGGDNHLHELGAGATILLDNQSIADTTSLNSSTSAHGFLKKLSNVAGDFMNGVGNWATPLVPLLFPANALSATIPASTTYYLTPFTTNMGATVVNALTTLAGTLKNFYVRINSAQPASGSLVCTVFVNGVATSITFTIAAGSGSGTYSNTANTASVNAGDRITFELKNNATGASAQIGAAVVELDVSLV